MRASPRMAPRRLESNELALRLARIAAAALLVVALGTVGYHFLAGPGHYSWLDCLFQTVVVVSTLGMDTGVRVTGTPAAKLFTIVLILAGVTVATYALTSLTAFVVEGELTDLIGRRRMDRGIAGLRDHYIVCGAGRTGANIIRELLQTRRPFVVIDHNEPALREFAARDSLLYVVGDATEEEVLHRAGVERAAGLLATLSNDRDNLYLVVTARHLNPRAKIVARVFERSATDKLKRAGADSVVSPYHIGGLRMISEMVRPDVVDFLDQMLRDGPQSIRFEEVVIHESAPLVGKTLAESEVRRETGLVIVACRQAGESYVYNPDADTVLRPGMALVVVGEIAQIERLRKLCTGGQ